MACREVNLGLTKKRHIALYKRAGCIAKLGKWEELLCLVVYGNDFRVLSNFDSQCALVLLFYLCVSTVLATNMNEARKLSVIDSRIWLIYKRNV